MTGDELRFLRNQLGLSQAQLSRLLDVPASTIARWERGELAIRHPTVLRLALAALATSRPPSTAKI